MNPVERLIFALDVPTLFDANKYVSILRGHVGAFKIGLELFSSLGPGVLRDPAMQKVPILLDLKLHDIPETVRRTVLKFEGLPILGITAHAAGGREMLEAAVSTGVPIYAVTVLTSISQRNLEDEGSDMSTRALVFNRTRIVEETGCAGIIASPLEVETIRLNTERPIEIVTPGIRPMGKDKDDQKRTSTPRAAISAGADRLVVGRPIRDDENPSIAANRIVKEIEMGLEERA